MRRLHDPTVGPTGRTDRSVRPVGPTVGSCKRSYDRSYDRSDESNMSNSSNRSDQQLHRLNVHPTVGPTIGPTMQMRSPNQPIKSTYNHTDFLFSSVTLRSQSMTRCMYRWCYSVDGAIYYVLNNSLLLVECEVKINLYISGWWKVKLNLTLTLTINL